LEELLEALEERGTERDEMVREFLEKWKKTPSRETQREISSHFNNQNFMTALSSSLMSPSVSSPELTLMICQWLVDIYNTKEHSLQLFVLCLLPALFWLFFSPSSDPTTRAACEATLLWIYNSEVAQCDTFELSVVTEMVASVYASEDKNKVLYSPRGSDKLRKNDTQNQSQTPILNQTTVFSPLSKIEGEKEGEVVRRVMDKFNTHLSSIPSPSRSLMLDVWTLLVSCGFPFRPSSETNESPPAPRSFPPDSVLEEIMDIVREPLIEGESSKPSEKKKEEGEEEGKGKGKEPKRKGKDREREEKEKEKDGDVEEETVEDPESENEQDQREREFKQHRGKLLRSSIAAMNCSREGVPHKDEEEVCGIQLHIPKHTFQFPFQILQEVVKCVKFCLYANDEVSRTKAKKALAVLHLRASADLDTDLLLLTRHLL